MNTTIQLAGSEAGDVLYVRIDPDLGATTLTLRLLRGEVVHLVVPDRRSGHSVVGQAPHNLRYRLAGYSRLGVVVRTGLGLYLVPENPLLELVPPAGEGLTVVEEALAAYQTLEGLGIAPGDIEMRPQPGAPLEVGIRDYAYPLGFIEPASFARQWPAALARWKGGGFELDADALLDASQMRRDLLGIRRGLEAAGIAVQKAPLPECLVHREYRLVEEPENRFRCPACQEVWELPSPEEGEEGERLVRPWNRLLRLRGERLTLRGGGLATLQWLESAGAALDLDDLVARWVLQTCNGACGCPYELLVAAYAADPPLGAARPRVLFRRQNETAGPGVVHAH